MSHLPPYVLTLFACVAVLCVHLSHAGPLLRLCSDSRSSDLEMRAWFFRIMFIFECKQGARFGLFYWMLAERLRHDDAIADPDTLLARCSR